MRCLRVCGGGVGRQRKPKPRLPTNPSRIGDIAGSGQARRRHPHASLDRLVRCKVRQTTGRMDVLIETAIRVYEMVLERVGTAVTSVAFA